MNRVLYSRLVSYYEQLENRDWKSELDLVELFLKRHDCRTVIDLGCGPGFQAIELAKRRYDVTGIDISEENIRHARMRASKQGVSPRFVLRSYYEHRPVKKYDAALCLNWSVPVKDAELKRFLRNAWELLSRKGLLIIDYERLSDLVRGDLGRPIVDTWDLGEYLVVRSSVGRMMSSVLSSRDVYILYRKAIDEEAPDEAQRYSGASAGEEVQVYTDRSYVRFFSDAEVRRFAISTGFRVLSSKILPRGRYRRVYSVLQKL